MDTVYVLAEVETGQQIGDLDKIADKLGVNNKLFINKLLFIQAIMEDNGKIYVLTTASVVSVYRNTVGALPNEYRISREVNRDGSRSAKKIEVADIDEFGFTKAVTVSKGRFTSIKPEADSDELYDTEFGIKFYFVKD